MEQLLQPLDLRNLIEFPKRFVANQYALLELQEHLVARTRGFSFILRKCVARSDVKIFKWLYDD